MSERVLRLIGQKNVSTAMVLIILRSIANLPSAPLGEDMVAETVRFVGEPMIALLLGVLIAFTLPKTFSTRLLDNSGWGEKDYWTRRLLL